MNESRVRVAHDNLIENFETHARVIDKLYRNPVELTTNERDELRRFLNLHAAHLDYLTIALDTPASPPKFWQFWK